MTTAIEDGGALEHRVPEAQYRAPGVVLPEMAQMASSRACGLGVAQIELAHDSPDGYYRLLAATVDAKMKYRAIGGVDGWFRAVLSGVLGNWPVGVATFLAVMGRTIIGKFIPVRPSVLARLSRLGRHRRIRHHHLTVFTQDHATQRRRSP